MLGKDGSVIGGRISPVRSSSAVVVSSQDLNRQTIYFQQQTVSAEGYAGQAFNTHVPHTVRTTETKTCTDCHRVGAGRQQRGHVAIAAARHELRQFHGALRLRRDRKGGIEAVAVTEKDEPQAVIGSELHRIAYPKEFAAHEKRHGELTTAVHHKSENALGVQVRGEYVYIADGSGGFKVFDVAQINQKGFSEKIVSAPVSPIGQNTNVKTREAMAVAAPSTLAVDPARAAAAGERRATDSPAVRLHLYCRPRGRAGAVDRRPRCSTAIRRTTSSKRAATFNPDGRLNGAVNLAIAGNYAYMLADRGLVVVDISTPLQPKVAAEVAAPQIRQPRSISIQFRYAFITDADGVKVVDITFPDQPRLRGRRDVKWRRPRHLRRAHLRICCRRLAGARHRRRRTARGAANRSDVQRRWRAERQPRREDRDDQRQRLRLCGRREERTARARDHLGQLARRARSGSARDRRRG